MHKAALTSAAAAFIAGIFFLIIAPKALPTSAAQPTTNLPPPPVRSQAGTPFAEIGALERNRKTPLEKFDRFLSSNDTTIVARAVIALGRLGNPAGSDRLTHILADSKATDDVRAATAFALGLLASPDSIPALADAIARGPSTVTAAAAEALGRIGGPQAIEILAKTLGSRDASIRAAVAVGLGEAAIPGAPALDDPHRQAAARAVASAILVERDQEVKWRMTWALDRSFYQSQAPVLRRLLTDDSELVRLFAVQGLGRLKDRSYSLPLRLASNDRSWRVRVEAHRALSNLGDRTKVDTKPAPVPKTDTVAPQPLASSAPYGDHPEVAFDTTKGFIVVELFPEQAPYSVDNFLYLVDHGFYNGLQYFRVIQDFVIQSGDPKNGDPKSSGGPGYSIPAELNPLQQLTGIISYGLDYVNKKPVLDSAGSQYYITESPQLHLDRAFSVFGRVVKGMAVVDAIAPHNVPLQPGDAPEPDTSRRVYRCKPVISQTAEIEAKLRTAEIGYDAR